MWPVFESINSKVFQCRCKVLNRIDLCHSRRLLAHSISFFKLLGHNLQPAIRVPMSNQFTFAKRENSPTRRAICSQTLICEKIHMAGDFLYLASSARFAISNELRSESICAPSIPFLWSAHPAHEHENMSRKFTCSVSYQLDYAFNTRNYLLEVFDLHFRINKEYEWMQVPVEVGWHSEPGHCCWWWWFGWDWRIRACWCCKVSNTVFSTDSLHVFWSTSRVSSDFWSSLRSTATSSAAFAPLALPITLFGDLWSWLLPSLLLQCCCTSFTRFSLSVLGIVGPASNHKVWLLLAETIKVS